MPRQTDYYRRRVPDELVGVVVQGMRLSTKINVPLREGMTRAKAEGWTDDLFAEAKAKLNFRLSETDAWELATAICNQAEALKKTQPEEVTLQLFHEGGVPDGHGWITRMGRTLSMQDHAKLQDWINRIDGQRFRVRLAEFVKSSDDPEALRGQPPTLPKTEITVAQVVDSVRSVMGETPPHSEIAIDYFKVKRRSFNYRSALRQFREVCGDKQIGQYTADDCWKFRKWLGTRRSFGKDLPVRNADGPVSRSKLNRCLPRKRENPIHRLGNALCKRCRCEP